MSDASQSRLRPGLGGLPGLLQVLSPLQAIADRASLARALAEQICETVALGCAIHVRDEGELRVLVELASVPLPPCPDVRLVVTSGRSALCEGSGPPIWVALVLRGPEGSFGALSVALDASAEEILSGALADLEALASILGTAIAEATDHERAARISQGLQASLLPSALPEEAWFELVARYVPGTMDLRIGGDWYDAQMLPNGTLALSVGDVAGHGIDAAAQMGELRAAMVALRLVRSAPDELISVMQRLASDMGYFATVVCARLARSGVLRWSSAGHLPPLVAHGDGSTDVLRSHQSPPLGVGPVSRVMVNSYRLSPGDIVLLYTDGLVERRDEPIDSSLGRLTERVAASDRTSPRSLIEDLVSRHDRSRSTGDDIALVAVRWPGAPPAGRA